MTRLVIATLVTLASPLWALAAPGGELIPKRVDELQRMTMDELAGEAANACIVATVAAHQAARFSEHGFSNWALQSHAEAKRARDYLERIGVVVRQKARGRTPAWMTDMTNQAWRGGGQQKCVDIYQALLTKRK
jgi:hypothetical protein